MSLSVDLDETYTILDCHARIQEFSSGEGGGGPGQSDKRALTTFFLVLSLFYSRKWLISKKTIIFQGSWGGPTFSRGGGGSNFFRGGGFQLLIPIENI